MGVPSGYVSPAKNLYQFLDTDGDESGTINAVGDYSSEAEDFFIQPPSGYIYEISRLIVNIQSDSVIASGKYGSVAALTNGVKAIVSLDGVETQINKEAIKSHDDWAGICHDSVALNYGASAGKSVSVRWSFFKSGANIWLRDTDKFIMRLNDDLQGLSKHRFFVNGIKHTE